MKEVDKIAILNPRSLNYLIHFWSQKDVQGVESGDN